MQPHTGVERSDWFFKPAEPGRGVPRRYGDASRG
jgi:hypothetical protein